VQPVEFIQGLVAACLGSNSVSWTYIFPGEKPNVSLYYCLLFKERKLPNGGDGIHGYDPANERTDKKIHEELMIIQH